MKQFFNNLKLGKKMLLSPLIVFIFLIILAGGTFSSFWMLKNAIDDIYNNRFQEYQNSSRIVQDVSSVNGTIYKIFNMINWMQDQQEIAAMTAKVGETMAQDVDLIKKILASERLRAEEKKLYEAVLTNLLEYQKASLKLLNLAVTDSTSSFQTVSTGMDVDKKYAVLNKNLSELLAYEKKLGKDTYDASMSTFYGTLTAFVVVFIIAVVLSYVITIAVTRLILTPVKESIAVLRRLAEGDLTQNIKMESKDEIGDLIDSVNTVSAKMNNAVGHALDVSEVLTDSSAKEASSIEETSASLQEIASMIKQNATNTEEANQLMHSASGAVQKANDAMEKLTTSMKEINKASEQTQKIVKSIDEIAFQTNLLALNASVEAARAGEAGAGFAVVADEVRNLALRATQSAHSSSGLIQDIVGKLKNGEELVLMTSGAFSEVKSSSDRVVELMENISVASQEQSRGIDQVNTAIAELNIETQKNAGNAESLSAIMSMFKTEAA